MTQTIAALPPTPTRDPDTAPHVIENDTLEQAKFWSSDEGASFGEVLDAVNPLHHIPVVSSIYRAVSGDTIGFGPRLIGAVIFGGPLGLIFAGISALFEEASGGNVAEQALALFEDLTGDGEPAPADVIATVPGHAGGDARDGTRISSAMNFDASAFADAPTVRSPITEAAVAADWSGEGPAAVAPVLRGAMSTAVPRQDVASVKGARFQMADSDSKRIARTLLQAQRAQANLLLANLQAYDAEKSQPNGDEDGRDSEARDSHTNLRPADAGPIWYADAMQRALDKYRTDHVTPTSGL